MVPCLEEIANTTSLISSDNFATIVSKLHRMLQKLHKDLEMFSNQNKIENQAF